MVTSSFSSLGKKVKMFYCETLQKFVTHGQCASRQTYGYLPSRTASLPLYRYATKLYCMVAEVRACEQLAYLKVSRTRDL